MSRIIFIRSGQGKGILVLAGICLAFLVLLCSYVRAQTHLGLAESYFDKSGAQSAIDYQIGLWTEPYYVARYSLKGASPKDKGFLERCLREYEIAASEDPRNVEALVGMGWAQFALKDYGAAAQSFEMAYSLLKNAGAPKSDQSRGDVAVALASTYFQYGRIEQAKALFEEAVEREKLSKRSMGLAHFGLAMIGYWNMDFDGAAAHLSEAEKSLGGRIYIRRARASLLACSGKLSEAVDALKQILKDAPEDTLAHDMLASILMSPWPKNSGSKPDIEPEVHLKAAISGDPGLIRAYFMLAKLYREKGQVDKEIELLRSALKVADEPDSEVIQRTLRSITEKEKTSESSPPPDTGKSKDEPGKSQLSEQSSKIYMIINNGTRYSLHNVIPVVFRGINARRVYGIRSESGDRIDWSPWYRPVLWVRLPSGDGKKRLDFSLVDVSGRAVTVQGEIILDVSPPRGQIEIIAERGVTSSRTVTLELRAYDEGSGVEAVSFAEDGMPWGPWEKYSFRRPFTIFGPEGETWVYVRFRDNAGNVSQAYGDSVILDLTPPKIKAVSPASIKGGSATISWFTDEESDSLVEYGTRPREYTRQARDGKYTTWHVITLEELEPGVTYYCRIRSRDLAGNPSEYKELRFTMPAHSTKAGI
ncbi:MAG TPA: tetratricopeptide repeat protein [Firmicutes bacterium]|nr:tetratricopeptide repeat protein [Bacillota bacterium]